MEVITHTVYEKKGMKKIPVNYRITPNKLISENYNSFLSTGIAFLFVGLKLLFKLANVYP